MKTFRKAAVEISLAFLIAGCIFFFPDNVQNSSKTSSINILNAVDKALIARHKKSPTIMKTQQNCTSTNITIPIAFYNVTTNITTYINFSNGGSCSGIPGVTGTTGVQTIVFPYISGLYEIDSTLDCTTGSSLVAQQITLYLTLQNGQIVVVSSTCGSLSTIFYCASQTSTQDATNVCNSAVSAACDTSTTLWSKVQGTKCQTYTAPTRASSTALYALFALVALPVLILGALILWYRTRQREADNQYMQDTATFSNVATSPQPLGSQQYYPPAATFEAGPPQYGDPYLKPY